MFGLSYLLEYNRYVSLIGIFIVLGIAVLFSHNRRHINLKLVGYGLLIQFLLAIFMLKVEVGQKSVGYIAELVKKLYQGADAGITFMFGPLASSQPMIFAIKVLPVIVFFGALMAVLFYIRLIPLLVSLISRAVRPLLGTSGAETLCAVANSFLGQTEAPLLVKGYLKSMTNSEILLVMIAGMSTISAAILAVYAELGVPAVHLLTSSIIAIPAAIVISKILYPETEKPATLEGSASVEETQPSNFFDAVSTGIFDGLQLALIIGAVLIAFIALISTFDMALGFIISQTNSLLSLSIPTIQLKTIFGFICQPFGWLLGFTGADAQKAGELIGTKVAVNEFVAYIDLIKAQLPERSMAILTYALCGFGSFASIGIQIGGIGSLAPEKKKILSQLGLSAVLGGTLANMLCALLAAVLL